MKELDKIENEYDSKITIENLKNIWKIVKRTCKNKRAVYNFWLNENTNIYNLYRVLKEKRYEPYRFKIFLIFEPKPRLVMSQTVGDKIVNHFIANYYLLPHIERKLIDSNVAARKNKGSSYALKLLEDYLNCLNMKNRDTNIYCLKLDIKKYFYNINHQMIIERLKKEIKDPDILNIIKKVITQTDNEYVNESVKYFNEKYNVHIPTYEKGTGLSIGTMTSQFIAIFYLNDLDHYIKEVLKCKYYVRYMDDFLILDTDKEDLKRKWRIIEEKIHQLKLELNPKTNLYNLKNGINFLGYNYKIRNNRLKKSYNKKTYKRIMNKLKYLNKYDRIKYYKSYASYYGYLSKIKKQERKFSMKPIEKYLLYKEKYPNYLILIKDGSLYKAYQKDSLIMWNFFGYKITNDCVAFNQYSYSKVLNYLNYNNINYVVVSEEDLVVKNNDEVYDVFFRISEINYETKEKRHQIHQLVDNILNNNFSNYEKLKEVLLEFEIPTI